MEYQYIFSTDDNFSFKCPFEIIDGYYRDQDGYRDEITSQCKATFTKKTLNSYIKHYEKYHKNYESNANELFFFCHICKSVFDTEHFHCKECDDSINKKKIRMFFLNKNLDPDTMDFKFATNFRINEISWFNQNYFSTPIMQYICRDKMLEHANNHIKNNKIIPCNNFVFYSCCNNCLNEIYEYNYVSCPGHLQDGECKYAKNYYNCDTKENIINKQPNAKFYDKDKYVYKKTDELKQNGCMHYYSNDEYDEYISKYFAAKLI
jgi:hypothetical protein